MSRARGRTLTEHHPSGRQISLGFDDQELTIVEVGGGIRSYTIGGLPVIDGYAEDAMCSGGRGQILAPWPNRIDGGRYKWRGANMQLALTEPARANANHGLVRWANWTLERVDDARATATLTLHPQPGYPFTLSLLVEYTLDAGGVTVTTTASNIGADTAPLGIGFHPYLVAGTARIDYARITLAAAEVLEADERGIPTGARTVPHDARLALEGTTVGARVFDHCYTGLPRDDHGVARATVESEDRRVTLWMDDAFDFAMVFTGDTLPQGQRRRSIAIEPMTCAPNAFNSGEGLITLEPGATHTSRWGLSAARA